MARNMKKSAGIVAGAAVVLAMGGAGGAVAGSMITGADIKDGTITSADIANKGVKWADIGDKSVSWSALTPGTQAKVKSFAGKDGKDGAKGDQGEAGPQGDLGPRGPKGDDGADGKDGVTNLIAGAGYTTTWAGDGGAEMQTAVGQCPDGMYALGGGFSTWGGDKDLGGDNKNIQVTVSAPYFEGEYIPVDEAGNFRPTQWVVKGFNNGDADQIVRPWVTCADVNSPASQ